MNLLFLRGGGGWGRSLNNNRGGVEHGLALLPELLGRGETSLFFLFVVLFGWWLLLKQRK